ncbi:MAG: hypothetical protein JW726_15340 [Anaerolineales bacterium]|nr:hypothetical protein [Anaerolineales bacterium]
MNQSPDKPTPDIHFMRITAQTVSQICELSETLNPAHRRMVADNVCSIGEEKTP